MSSFCYSTPSTPRAPSCSFAASAPDLLLPPYVGVNSWVPNYSLLPTKP